MAIPRPIPRQSPPQRPAKPPGQEKSSTCGDRKGIKRESNHNLALVSSGKVSLAKKRLFANEESGKQEVGRQQQWILIFFGPKT
ncbi:MAG: hypothetical protein LBH14_05620 [Desulfobulbaceae bacterium]|jgi:hypothetical protein|nr:hypothetical protein [Desulfobulbaceae bacterium]